MRSISVRSDQESTVCSTREGLLANLSEALGVSPEARASQSVLPGRKAVGGEEVTPAAEVVLSTTAVFAAVTANPMPATTARSAHPQAFVAVRVSPQICTSLFSPIRPLHDLELRWQVDGQTRQERLTEHVERAQSGDLVSLSG